MRLLLYKKKQIPYIQTHLEAMSYPRF
jgi:hypothetical protein